MKIGMKGNEAIPGEGQRSYEMDNISYREDALEYAVVINGHSLVIKYVPCSYPHPQPHPITLY